MYTIIHKYYYSQTSNQDRNEVPMINSKLATGDLIKMQSVFKNSHSLNVISIRLNTPSSKIKCTVD